jgi:phosphoribosylaminoimidazolecarboxamide formyltransferase/IMP cyclohydrolase
MGRAERVPPRLVLALERVSTLRYGENPHQEAAIYGRSGTYPWWRQAEQVQGKEMSFNNYADAEAAWRLACAFREPGAVVVKHTNPCGAAIDDSIGAAFERAWACDAQSAFGGVVALNRPLDVATAELIGANFVEVVIAPALEPEAHDILSRKSNLRILVAGPPSNLDHDVRGMEHGLLVQVRDAVAGLPDGWRVVAGEAPSERLCAELDFAWTVAAHTKSNAIVIGANRAAVGVGAGDQSRVGAAERAVARAGRRAQGGVAASDAFLPFRDGLDVLADAGVTALVEPGGSRRDDEVIAAAVERNVTLVFTGRRHFRH